MAVDPRMRASDADRDRTARLLREHHAVGRLDVEEFNERLDKVLTAKTIGELEELTTDLPGIDLYPLPTASMPRKGTGGGLIDMAGHAGAITGRHGRLSTAWRAAWASWFTTGLICTVVWVAAGGGYFWPVWVIGPWGAALFGSWIFGNQPGHHHGRDRRYSDRG